ncbi:DUF5000 domain-containing lipoprotein [Parapedobacter sp. 10938]|uniref:DUF5000 domain-containing lipoprotein n=1 Tax=Parapedobacter flavus TaxID=3110225 RepID=UPI002DBCC5E1|nr:DUF5000 domain-containing lipoprotein [Parapedobacter sp. 10938]MEC3880031.1 DUF5000 domain-containing lipoprotein [Parapedobacter sp. 10938]
MKNITYYLGIILFVGGFMMFSSCGLDSFDETIPLNPVLTPIKSVTAQDGPQEVVANISDKNRTIELEFFNIKSLEEVEVKLKVSKRAKLLAPHDTVLVLNLNEPHEIVINDLFDDLTYTLTATIPEYIKADKTQFSEYRLDNDGGVEEGSISYLWDDEYMLLPGDYGSIGYRNYLTRGTFTFDIGTRYDGSYYDLKQFKANLYWAYTNVCPKVYELWGYMKEGNPPKEGDWSDWERLGTLDNSKSTLDDFGEGDNLNFEKESSPSVRYLRVKVVENYRNDDFISLSEVTLWGWNK